MNSSPVETVKVLFLAAEADPFIKVGGLADYAGSLPYALKQVSPRIFKNKMLDIRLAMPLHGEMDRKKWHMHHLVDFTILEKNKTAPVRVYTTTIHDLIIYFISRKHPESADTPVYPYKDSKIGQKYAFFSIASLELLKILDWPADILHANDWHTAFSIIKLAQAEQSDLFFAGTESLLTIHNLAFMGGGSEKVLADYDLKPVCDPSLPKWAHSQPLPMAMSVCDAVVTVSPSYAREIQTPQFGYGLEKLIKKRRKTIYGILNGIDYEKWDPSRDPYIKARYSIGNINARRINKSALQKNFNLPSSNQKIPLITLISRLDYQKGIDLLTDGFEQLKDLDFQLIILGSGNREIENNCQKLSEKFPERVRTILKFDSQLANQLYSGADMILIPSRFEPCGLTQMIAMRYGCLPIARATGGLKDTIQDGINGFLFNEFSSSALLEALKKAIGIFKKQKRNWRWMQENAMRADFSWQKSAKAYARLYLKLLAN